VDENKKVPRSGVSETLRSVAEELHKGSPNEQTVAQAIDGLADASDAVRDKDLKDAIRAVDTFARSNPLIFISAAAFAGFAATRLIKAVRSDGNVERAVPPSKDAS
jgi:hypothetical protein